MRVLVTGGAGVIGSHVADELPKAGHEIRILDVLDPQVHSAGDSLDVANREPASRGLVA